MAARLSSLTRLTKNLGSISSRRHVTRTKYKLRHFHTSFVCSADAIKIKMPSLSPTMYEGSIVQWHKKEGDLVAAGEILCDIQTDKTVVGFEIEEDCVLAKILVSADSGIIKIGTLIGLMVEEGEDWQDVEVPADTETSTLPSGQTETTPSSKPAESSTQGIGPAVRGLLDLYNISATEVHASGPHNNLLKGDVLEYVKSKDLKAVVHKVAAPAVESSPAPAAPASAPKPAPTPVTPAPVEKTAFTAPPAPPAYEGSEYSDLELSSMRKVIAKRLSESKMTTPHAYSTIGCNISKLLRLRKNFKDEGVSVSVNDFIIKACAVALQKVPEVNALWSGEEGRMLSNIDISVAVATDSGLITPIVKDAIGLGLQDISLTVRELAGRAKEGRLKPEEFQGGTFTISNLGMFGISEFTAVINPPQACIMAVGGSQLELDTDGIPQTVMKVTLSSDVRIVDEFLATRFLEAFKEIMEDPMLMLSQSKTTQSQVN